MHELSIAQAIVAIVSRHARGRKVHRVELKVGHLRQVVPSALWDWMRDGDAGKVERIMQALMQMTKLELATLKRAYEGSN